MQEVGKVCVSVVVPAYNAGKYLAETIRSVVSQTYTRWELIIIDDGSTDDTQIVIQEFSHDKRISSYHQRNAGVSAARNAGFEKCTGKYIALLDADDLWLPDNLQAKVGLLESSPDVKWVFSDMLEYIQSSNLTFAAPAGRDDNILENILLWEGEVVPGPCSNLVVRSDFIVEYSISFDRALSTAADQDFCLQLARYSKGRRIPEPLWKYRVIASSMSRNIKVMEKDHRLVYQKAKELKLFKSFWFQQRCFSNLYFILSANWWKAGSNKMRGLYFASLALLNYPPVLLKYFNKLLHAFTR